jgi:MinD superfamily P-loop ATPase
VTVAVASGKGGTGKTTVAVNLAEPPSGAAPLFLGYDVEEPNAALFLRPVIQEQREVGQMIPAVDMEACTYCGRRAEVCQYHAIAVVGKGRGGAASVLERVLLLRFSDIAGQLQE